MKKIMFVLFVGFLSGCDDEPFVISENYNDEAVYEGVFLRSSPTARYRAADVTITFQGNTFSGTIGEDNYPAICNGTFTINDNVIDFTNACYWTADFDWSLILSGAWTIEGDQNELTLTKKTGEITDMYFLTRKTD